MYNITMNQVRVPEPITWDITYETKETVNETEAGTDQIIMIRKNKISISAAFQVSSRIYAFFQTLKEEDYFSVSFYNPIEDTTRAYQMRLRDFIPSLVQNSAKKRGTSGLWNITFTLIQF